MDLMSFRKRLAPLLVALVVTVGLAACGGSDGSDSGNDMVSGTFEVLPSAPAGYDNLSGEAELTRSDGETTTAISLNGLEPDTEYMAHLHTGGCTGSDPGGPHFKFDPEGSDEPPNEIHLTFTSDGDGSGDAEVGSDQEVPVGEAGSVVLHFADPDAMASTGDSTQFAALFVHEGEDHSEGEPGEDHGSGAEPGHDGGGVQQLPDKIACAELEGGSATAGGGEGTAAVPTVVVKSGEPVGGIAELEFSAGEQIRFKVTGDEAEEIHIHGYDLMEDIPAGGGTVEFDFPAEIEGIFEGELEGQGTQILELRVNP
jgi:Cu-Zn family superoxide dismutase